MFATKSLQRFAVNPSMNFLGLQQRSFSSINSRIFNNTIFMPELFPAQLAVPTKSDETFTYTCENTATVASFKQRVLDNPDVSSFELVPSGGVEALTDKMTLGQLKQKPFEMKVNNKTYNVYPDMRSITQNTTPVTKNKKELAKQQNMEGSISIGRQIILHKFYHSLVVALKKEAGTGGKLSQEKLDKAFKLAITAYSEQLKADSSLSEATMADLRSELDMMEAQKTKILKESHKHAGMMLGLGLMGSFAQLVGFYTGIYVIYDWNEMEPWTFIFQAFYLMIGSFYYMTTKGDWVYTSVYGHLQQKKLNSLMQQQGFNEEKFEAMGAYINQLEEQVSMINGAPITPDSEQAK